MLSLAVKKHRHVRTVEMAGSFSFKLNIPGYQSADFFQSAKAECREDEAEEVADKLHQFCKQQVLKRINEFCKSGDVQAIDQAKEGFNGLIKRSESSVTYLEVKHYRIWQQLEREVAGCDVVEANNPKTKQTVQKYGWGFAELTARAMKIVKYDTESKYATRYYGFKLHLVDDADGSQFVLDMPYHSGLLRKFLRIAPSIDWSLPFTIQVWKGKAKEGQGAAETAILFRQSGETVKWFFTREHANGMPEPTQDADTKEWDYKAQHKWLIEDMKARTIPAIEKAAAAHSALMPEPKHEPAEERTPGWDAPIDDDDVPF